MVTCSVVREELLKSLQWVCGVIDRRPTQPILSHILFHVERDRLVLRTTDLETETQATAFLQEQATQTAMFTAPARKLLDLFRSFEPRQEVRLCIQPQSLVVECQQSRCELASLNVDDFPLPLTTEHTIDCTFSVKQWLNAFSQTGFAVSVDDTRKYLNALLIELEGTEMHMVGADGHRLARCVLGLPQSHPHTQYLLPRKAVFEVQRLLGTLEDEESVVCRLGTHGLNVHTDQGSLHSRWMAMSYPNYRRVLPQNTDKIIEIDKETWKQSLQRLMIFSQEHDLPVVLNAQKDRLCWSVKGEGASDAIEQVVCRYDGPEFTMAFKPQYLLDVLNHILSSTLKFKVGSLQSGVLFQGDEENSLFLVMPVKL